MEKRKLGNSGLAIAPFVLGGNVFGWTADEPTSFAVLDAFVGAGFDCIDTADTYSVWAPGNKGGESETIIGSWLKRRGGRDKLVIATKVGGDMGGGRKGVGKDYILSEVETSLKRLQTDYIDLYQTHFDDEATPVEETLEAYATLVRQGKVRAIGASNVSPARIARSLQASRDRGLPRYEVLQPHYNLAERKQFESELEGLCRREGLGVIPYFSLAAGFLTGKYRKEADVGGRARAGDAGKYLNAAGLRILAAMDRVSRDTGATLPQIALAWLLAKPVVTAPIASATSVAQLQDLLKATELGLDPAALDLLDKASA